MCPASWQAHVEAHQRKEARARSWEARLHGLKHKSGRALTAADFLPDSLKSVSSQDAEAVYAAFEAAFAPIQNAALQKGPHT